MLIDLRLEIEATANRVAAAFPPDLAPLRDPMVRALAS
jgi:hypothetical protein